MPEWDDIHKKNGKICLGRTKGGEQWMACARERLDSEEKKRETGVLRGSRR